MKENLKQQAEKAQKLENELLEAGVMPLDGDELDEVTGGKFRLTKDPSLSITMKK